MSSTIGRAALVVSAGILASRLLGFVREMVLAAVLGRSIRHAYDVLVLPMNSTVPRG